jgi:hypothetical protein
MICEKCAEEITTTTCEGCGKEIRALGPFCYLCGHQLGEAVKSNGSRQEPSVDQTESAADSIDLSSRVLCSDGTCIGVIDEHGKCKICGKPYIPES